MCLRRLVITVVLLFCVISHLVYGGGNSINNSININIAGLYSSNTGIWQAEAIRTVTEFAIHMINNDTTILSDYFLNITWKDSRCDRRISADKFVEFIAQKDVVYHFIFGPYCSRAAEPLGPISPAYHLNILSPTATSPLLTNPLIYPTVSLGVPTYINLIVIYLKLIDKYQWRRVGILSEDGELFNTLYEILEDNLKVINVDYDSERIYNSSNFDEIDTKLARLFISGRYKIIIGNFYQDRALNVFCRAFKSNYYYPYVTWLLPSRFTTAWLSGIDLSTCEYTGEEPNNYCCTKDDINTFLQGAIGVDIAVRLTDHNIAANDTANVFRPHEMTVFGESRKLLWNKIYSHVNDTLVGLLDPSVEKYTLYAFDSIVTLAYLFEIALEKDELILSEFNYHDPSSVLVNKRISNLLTDSLESITFSGLSGNVSYKNRARELAPGEIVEFINGSQELRGVVSSITSADVNQNTNYDSDFEMIYDFTYFGKGQSGFDGAELHVLPLAALIIAGAVTLVACVYTLFFYFIVFLYRKRKVINFSSPLLNTGILTGSMINCVIAVIVLLDNRVFKQTPEDDPTSCVLCSVYCHVAWWLPAIATDFIFGILVGKSYIAYRIGKSSSPRFSRHSVALVLLFVFGLVMFDTILVIVWALIPDIKLLYIAYGPYETSHTDITETGSPYWFIFSCGEGETRDSLVVTSRFVYIFLRWILFGVGLYYASQLSKLYITGVHEFRAVSRSIITAVFFNLFRVVLLTSILSVSLTDIATTLLSFSYSIDTFIIMSHIFVPKLYYIITDPQEKKEYTGVHNTADMELDSTPKIHKKKEELVRLSKEQESLERKILELKPLEKEKRHKSTTTELGELVGSEK